MSGHTYIHTGQLSNPRCAWAPRVNYNYIHAHNNNNQCKMCWNKALTFGVGSNNYIPLCSPNTHKGVFNPNVTIYISVKLIVLRVTL